MIGVSLHYHLGRVLELSSVQAPIIATCVATLLLSNASAMADEAKARLGRVLWSAFQCSTFAEMSGNEQEQERLFGVGVKAGREFLEALKNRQISPDAVKSEVPIGVSMLLQGPSTDFIVGRIFESAAGDAFDKIVKQKNGMPLEISDWINDKEVRKAKASNSYLVQNCRLIQ